MTDTVPILGQTPQLAPGDVLEMKYSLIRIEEQLKSSRNDAEHRHANIKQTMEAFVPRRELDQIFAGITARLTSVDGEMREKATAAEVAVVRDDLKTKASSAALDTVKGDLKKVEDNQIWVIRGILTAIIAAIAGAVAYAVKHG